MQQKSEMLVIWLLIQSMVNQFIVACFAQNHGNIFLHLFNEVTRVEVLNAIEMREL